MQRTSILLVLAAGIGLSAAASAQQGDADARYCDRLVRLYRTYINNPEDPRPAYASPNAAHEAAIADCKAGNPAAGIPRLEKALQDNKLTLPKRGDG
jgi:hypothetical protein